MKVYVSELPKDCLECPFCQDIKVNVGMDRLLFCKANKGKAIKNMEKSFDKCIVKNEFQSLVDYTKQVRKEVVQEIGKKLKENGLLYTWKGVPKYKTMEELLDQIQGDRV